MTEIKFNLVIEYYKIHINFLWRSHAEAKSVTLKLDSDDLNVFKFITSTEKPFSKQYLILEEADVDELVWRINRLILTHIDHVLYRLTLVVTSNELPVQVYTKDLKKTLNPVLTNRNKYLTNVKEILKFYRESKYEKSIETMEFIPTAIYNLKPVSVTFIGYTNQRMDVLVTGKELECEIYLRDTNEIVKDYIFISPMYSISAWDSLFIYEYYIMSPDFEDKARIEFSRLHKKYRNCEIITYTPVFEYEKFKNQKFKNTEFRINAPLVCNLTISENNSGIASSLEGFYLTSSSPQHVYKFIRANFRSGRTRMKYSCRGHRPDFVEQYKSWNEK